MSGWLPPGWLSEGLFRAKCEAAAWSEERKAAIEASGDFAISPVEPRGHHDECLCAECAGDDNTISCGCTEELPDLAACDYAAELGPSLTEYRECRCCEACRRACIEET